jgi:cytochrome c oxidase subunit 3
VLFFAGLFCAYSVYRSMHPEVFVYAHYFLDT